MILPRHLYYLCFSSGISSTVANYMKSQTTEIFSTVSQPSTRTNESTHDAWRHPGAMWPGNPSGRIVVDGSYHPGEVMIWCEDGTICTFRHGQATQSRSTSPSSRVPLSDESGGGSSSQSGNNGLSSAPKSAFAPKVTLLPRSDVS